MALLDKIFKKKPSTSELIDYFTKLSPQDIEDLKSIASGTYTANTESKYKNYLDLIERVYTNSYVGGENSPQTRKQLYNVYDEMDETVSYISAALDIISDDATQPDQDGSIIKVYSDSEKVLNLTQQMIDDLEIEERLAKWARVIAKYGDFFIRVFHEEGKGVTKLLDTIYPSRIERYDFDGELVAFSDSEETLTDEVYAPWEFIHFKHKGDITQNKNRQQDFVSSRLHNEHDLTSSYGQSILRPAVKVYAQLRFVENMILLSRLTNSVRRNIFAVNVGDVAPDKAMETVQNYATLLKKNINLDLESSIYNSQKRTIPYDEDIFLPVSDPKNDLRIEQIGGDANIAEQYDLEYLLNKLFSALKVPKAYLNYEQDLNARSTLIQLDIRYARTVSRLQQTIRGGLIRLAKINLAYHGINPDTTDIDIQLTQVSTIDAEAKRQELQAKIEVASSFWNTVATVNEKLSGGNSNAANPLAGILGEGEEVQDQSDSDEGVEYKGLDLEYAAELLFDKYLELSKDELNRLLKFKKDKSDDSHEESKTKKVVFRRVKSSDPDIHAMYPTDEGKTNYKKLQENFKASRDNKESIENLIT